MPVEDKHELKQPKQPQQLQRHSTPIEDEDSTTSNGAKEEKTIPTKYVSFFNPFIYIRTCIYRTAAQSGMKPPTVSIEPAGKESQTTAPIEPRPHGTTGPFKIDTSKYEVFTYTRMQLY